MRAWSAQSWEARAAHSPYRPVATGRCVLEKGVKRSGAGKLSRRGSLIRAGDNFKDWIETDQCLTSSGLDRNSFGVSSDALLDSCFHPKLCSSLCLPLCPNIADLYSNIAAAEGVLLPEYCEAQRTGTRRGLADQVALKSSGLDAAEMQTAPAPAPAFCDSSS